jgi:hypothetical protein
MQRQGPGGGDRQDGNSDVGRNRLFRLLRADGWIYKEGGHNVPHQKSTDQKLMLIRTIVWTDEDGKSGKSKKIMFTQKGRVKFVWLYGKKLPFGKAPASPLVWSASLADQLRRLN